MHLWNLWNQIVMLAISYKVYCAVCHVVLWVDLRGQVSTVSHGGSGPCATTNILFHMHCDVEVN
jgi:hypothetical protein